MSKDKKAVNDRISDYVLCHLSDVAGGTTEITEQIEEMLIHPHRNTRNENSLKLWRKLAHENLAYISQGLCDLREFENTDGIKN